ncbi:MAG: hypothetical protein DRQ88_05180 [Epsilonproteobacteria bacterium]|nr:MAG: hypothetical protein DRQ89_04575 [Campylobacterota bacterium]RLA66821.1 MAG: hypothetical protein DRQ88_05180 [Campylobacterota bacterium]
MNSAVISDIHIKGPETKSYRLFLSFLSQKEVLESSTWYFLGDIFDLMIGNHLEYFEKFPEFFNRLAEYLKNGGSVHYLEGNHDFHLEGLFLKYLEMRNIPADKFFYHREAFRKELNGKSFYFCHGDDIQSGNFGYVFLKYLLRNPLSGLIINKLASFFLLQKIGSLMSGNSRKYNDSKFGDTSGQKLIKEKFRKFARDFWTKNKCDYLICGHSHVLDDYPLGENGRYINIGLPPVSNKYLLIEGPDLKFMEIT